MRNAEKVNGMVDNIATSEKNARINKLKREKEKRKRKAKAKDTMLETVHHIGLVASPELDNSVWKCIRDGRELLMCVDVKNRGEHLFALVNWRLLEIQVMLLMLERDWMKLEAVTPENAKSYVAVNRVASVIRRWLAHLKGDMVTLTAPIASAPEECRSAVQREFHLITHATGHCQFNAKAGGELYRDLTVLIVGIVQLSCFNTIEMAVRYNPKSTVDETPFSLDNVIGFIKYVDVEDFPHHLAKWNEDNASYLASQHENFNVKEAFDFLQSQWDRQLY